jgi:hypothetical protein
MTKPNPEHKVTICHAVSGQGELKNGYNEITVDVASIFKHGHDEHLHEGRTDVIPPFVYIGIDGLEHSYPGLGDQSLLPLCRVPEPTTTTHKPTTTKATTTSTSTSSTSSSTTSTTSTTSSTSSTTTTTCPDCVPNTVVTVPGSTTTTTSLAGTTTTVAGQVAPFSFGAAATVCVREVPTIRIQFQNTFPELAGQTGTLTMADVNGTVVSTQPLVYRPNTTVNLLYPGTRVNADGSIADVPGWNLTAEGLWARDSSDEFLREGIRLTYTVNPTATALVTYPPESSACANPDNGLPRAPGTPITSQPSNPPPAQRLGFTGADAGLSGIIAATLILGGTAMVRAGRWRRGVK